MAIQQTVLRVKTTKPGPITVTGTTSIAVSDYSGVTYSGSGSKASPYLVTYPGYNAFFEVQITGDGTLYFDASGSTVDLTSHFFQALILHPGETFYKTIFNSWSRDYEDYFKVTSGDKIKFFFYSTIGTATLSTYFAGDIEFTQITPTEYDTLDLLADIPLTITKSFAEIQDISKRNSDYSIGIKLPGTKKNNRFFESYFNVDNDSLYFNATKKVECNVLIDDESYFAGYMKLNRISVLKGQVEYDVTLISTVGDLYGKIGNNLLTDLDFRDVDYHFNHVFTQENCLANWRYESLKSAQDVPSKYFYPVVHNGYNYQVTGNTTFVQFTGTTGTSLYTTTKIGSWANNAAAYAAGVSRYRINSPEDGLRDYQLKPAVNVYSLIQLIFKTYGYKIKSDFFTTPWFKLLYMYGGFSDDKTTLSYQAPGAQTFGSFGVDVIATYVSGVTYDFQVVKEGTGVPALCDTDVVVNMVAVLIFTGQIVPLTVTIPAGQFSSRFTIPGGYYIYSVSSPVGYTRNILAYPFSTTPQTVVITDGNYLDFSTLFDQNIKQIDILSSIAKKFNLLFISDPQNSNQIIVEPYEYYVGSGNVYDWTDKMSWDKGFSVEPAFNYIESEIILTDKEDGDQGNIDFKKSNNRIYGENKVYNPTDFKSTTKTIDTTFSPMVVRKWNPNNNPGIGGLDVGIPLGIGYTEESQEISTTGTTSVVDWVYKGVKTKPKLIYNLGNFSPFLDAYGEILNLTGSTTTFFRVTNSSGTTSQGSLISPVISPTMPLGNIDSNKINNDSICIMFNSEQQTTIAGDSVTLPGILTNQNAYTLFYQNRINNASNKNTRVINGLFDLKLSDIKNLRPNDLIKINEQYFTWNKIDDYNLIEPELTKVELIQFNNNVKQYPTRYFKYQYCSNTITYKFKTEFTGQTQFNDTFYYYSILYDYFVGVLGGNVSGFTTSVPYTGTSYLPFSMWEVSEAEYNASGTSYTDDPNKYYFLEDVEEYPTGTIYSRNNMIWMINSGTTRGTLNVFPSCAALTSAAASLGVTIANASIGTVYSSGITLNVTSAGYIRYNTAAGQQDVYFNTGVQDIPGCADCSSIRPAYVFYPIANWSVIDCGTPC